MGSGGSSTTVDVNNPYSNALAKNAQSAYGVYAPFLKAQLEGRSTPYTDITTATTGRNARHYAGKYGTPVGDINFQEGLTKSNEASTMPNAAALSQLMGMYGYGTPSSGGSTSNTQQNLGTLDYLQLAATIAGLSQI